MIKRKADLILQVSTTEATRNEESFGSQMWTNRYRYPSCPQCGEIFSIRADMARHRCEDQGPERGQDRQEPLDESRKTIRIELKGGRLALKTSVQRQPAKTVAKMEERKVKEEEAEQGYECEVCSAIFPNPITCRQHVASDHLEPSGQSNRANGDHLRRALQSGKDAELRSYNTIDDEEATTLYTCSLCPATYDHKADLFSHSVAVHKKRVLYECPTCEQVFVQRQALNRHLQGHASLQSEATNAPTVQYECQFCGKPFPFESHLRRHLATHTGEPHFVCDLCGIQFKSQGSLVLHKAAHTGERPFPCSKCGKAFPYRSYLERHYKTHSTTPLRCPQCPKIFRIPSQLQKHVAVDHVRSESTLSCPYCDRKFIYPSYLERHLVTHDQSKEHECPICQRQFSARSALLVHLQRHMPDSYPRPNPYKCGWCDNSYRHESNLEKHVQKVHADVSGFGPR